MKIGKVTSVNFNQFKVKISSDVRGGSVVLGGSVYYFGNIGSYLKINNPMGEILICEVVSIFDNDDSKLTHSFDVDGNRELLIKPVGTINKDGGFGLGVGIYPGIYSDVSIVTFDDMKVILRSNDADENNTNIHKSFYLGESKSLINYPINIQINSFFNIHSAVLGNSGSGKSNTVAHIIQEIHNKNQFSAIGSKIVIFDVNGEYKNAFNHEKLNPDISIKLYKPNIVQPEDGFQPFFLPYFLMNLDEWGAFLLATEATQRPFWDRVLQESYRFYKIGGSDAGERKKFVDYLRHKVCSLVYSILNQADTDTANITAASSIISTMRSIIEGDVTLKGACDGLGLSADLATLQGSCALNYGQNNKALQGQVQAVYEKIDQENLAKVFNFKLPHGEYFDYRFLKISVDIALLEEDARGSKRMREYTSTMLSRLDYFLDNPDCFFMRGVPGGVTGEKAYIDSIWEPNDDESHKTQMVIIDTSELSPDALESLTSVFSRIIYSGRRKLLGDERRKKPIHLILDEAHRYIKKDHKYILKENIFDKIAREGRKYSVYLLISSQRPSELSETVLSQCSNFIIHRIQNEVDMRYVNAVLPYFSEDFTNKIKQSAPGEALVFGNCVSMPLHVKIKKSNPEPNSKNCDISEEWFRQKPVV